MHQIAKGYTTDQLKSVADYYAALPAPTAQGSTRR
jgi:cytochrome c553